jgi:hypothetical protein
MSVLDEIAEEMAAQIVQWGEQNHPMLDQTLLKRKGGCEPARMTREYELPSETRAKFLLDEAFKKGEGTYMHILVEEVAEAASEFDLKRMRVELKQVAAVAATMMQAIDRSLALS